MSIDYKALMPALGEAAALSRQYGVPYHVVQRDGLLWGSKTVAVRDVKPGDTVIVSDVGFCGVSSATIDGNHAAFFDAETRGVLLRALRHVLDIPASAPVPAVEGAAGLFALACMLSEHTYAERRKVA